MPEGTRSALTSFVEIDLLAKNANAFQAIKKR
jgi:hypothetical protein